VSVNTTASVPRGTLHITSNIRAKPIAELWQTCGASPVICDHTVLPVTLHRQMAQALHRHYTSKMVLDLPAPEGWKAELTLVATGFPQNFDKL